MEATLPVSILTLAAAYNSAVYAAQTPSAAFIDANHDVLERVTRELVVAFLEPKIRENPNRWFGTLMHAIELSIDKNDTIVEIAHNARKFNTLEQIRSSGLGEDTQETMARAFNRRTVNGIMVVFATVKNSTINTTIVVHYKVVQSTTSH